MVNRRRKEEVGMSECRTTRSRLTTGGASTCIILAALNIETNTGLLGHFSHDDVVDGELIDEAVEAITHLGPGGSTQIRLAGGGVYFTDGAEHQDSVKYNAEVEQRVRMMAERHGIPLPNVVIAWLQGNDEASAEVDCEKRTITIEEEVGDYDFS